MKKSAVFIPFFFALLVSLGLGPAQAGDKHLRLYETQGSFDEAKIFLQDAIINQGLVIDYNGRIGLMLERTRADVDGARKIYKNAEFFLFCSATISRATMEADPTNMSFCPYVMFIYELEGEADKVYVGYRRPQLVGSDASKKSLAAVDRLLDAIAKEATE